LRAGFSVSLGRITTTTQDANKASDDGRKLGNDNKDMTGQRRSEDMRDRSTDHNNHS
jgi:hypothetical protein